MLTNRFSEAKGYFVDMGWECPSRQTTGDFLTSVTNPQERTTREGMENKVPRTPDEFAAYWKKSPYYANLKKEIAQYREEYPLGGVAGKDFYETKRLRQAKHVRPKSPYVISIPMQVRLCVKRAYQRLVQNSHASLFPKLSCLIFVQHLERQTLYADYSHWAYCYVSHHWFDLFWVR
jgi:ATP-binding cassette subfamily G (WHITE) protein 2 (PDR)